jgi:predicted small secreted protein
MFRKTIIAALAISFALTTAACNTVKGLGRDITSVGDAGSKAVKK